MRLSSTHPRPSKRIAATVHRDPPRAAKVQRPPGQTAGAEAAVKRSFATRFRALAQDRDAFHQMMRTVYGGQYDMAKAESLRRRALAGDVSWLPPIEFRSDAELRGANGAYDARRGVVYLNASKMGMRACSPRRISRRPVITSTPG